MKSPAFQLYPDKADTGTRHLSDRAFRAYWRIIWFLWLHGKGQFSMKNTPEMWKIATGLNGEVLESVREEIMNPDFRLLRTRGQILFSNGLKKEAKKQKEKRLQNQKAAKARWEKEKQASTRSADAKQMECFPSPIPPTVLNTGDDGIGTPSSPSCPHDKIVHLYHASLPMMPRIVEWSEGNQRTLRARWRERKERQTLEWWQDFFSYVDKSDFLTGRAKNWMADLGWLIKAGNFTKVINGVYHKHTKRQVTEQTARNLANLKAYMERGQT